MKQALYRHILYLYLLVTAKYRLKPRKRLRFETDVVGHCNLNCRSCYHFSPLAENDFVKTEVFEKDFARLSELAGRDNDNIDIMGGEPLLHPELTTLMEIARKYFDGPVNIVTNGLLLEHMSDAFWESCNKNNIRIIVTRYPVKLNIKRIKELAGKHGVTLKFRLQFMHEHTWCRLPFDLSGSQNIKKNFKLCLVANFCIFLRDGKLSTCCLPLLIGRFNNQFGENMETACNDYIDIYEVNDINEVYKFVSRPISFCRYCKISSWEIGIKWGLSKKEKNEWI